MPDRRFVRHFDWFRAGIWFSRRCATRTWVAQMAIAAWYEGTRFFTTSQAAHHTPTEVITDRAPALANGIDELIPAALHNTGQYQNNRCECDHGRLRARLRPMRGLKTNRTASIVIRGHASVQNLRRGHYDMGVDTAPVYRLVIALDELRLAI
jgi:IS6 family transposase